MDALTTGQIIEQLKASLALAQVHAQAARIELRRRDEQIAAMAEEVERLRAEVARHRQYIQNLWTELAHEAGEEPRRWPETEATDD